jgi:hypothetical protein
MKRLVISRATRMLGTFLGLCLMLSACTFEEMLGLWDPAVAAQDQPADRAPKRNNKPKSHDDDPGDDPTPDPGDDPTPDAGDEGGTGQDDADPPDSASPSTAALYVATNGSDSNPGTEASPLATLQAAEDLANSGDTIIVKDGTYTGFTEFDERWTSPVLVKAEHPLRVRLQNGGTDGNGGMVVHINGATNLTLEGFDITQSGLSTSDGIVFVDWHNNLPTDDIAIRHNYVHDAKPNGSGSGDLIKTSNGSHGVLFRGNVFVNPGAEEHSLDLNSLVASNVEGNLFWHDYGRSPVDAKSHIVIKDSGGSADNQVGAEDVWVGGNVFGHVEHTDSSETWAVQIGADNRDYVEAREIVVRNNLLIGDSRVNTGRPFGVEQAHDVTIAHNTLTGDLPVTSQHFLTIRQDNAAVINDGLVLANNLITDPTGAMGRDNTTTDTNREVIGGDSTGYQNLVFNNNLWWNDGQSFPTGGILQPHDDAGRVVADPLLNEDHSNVVGPIFDFASGEFASGEDASSVAIDHELARLVAAYGDIPSDSPAVDAADGTWCSAQDILGVTRPATNCDIGAVEHTR